MFQNHADEPVLVSKLHMASFSLLTQVLPIYSCLYVLQVKEGLAGLRA